MKEQFSPGYLFLRVAKWSVKVKRNGARAVSMSLWDAYLSKLYALAELPNYRAARLLNQLRKQFPGNALPSDPPVFIISEADAKL